MKRVTVLGSTGSIGKKALEIIAAFPNKFKLEAIACESNTKELKKQIALYKPNKIGVVNKYADIKFKKKLFVGEDGIAALSRDKDSDLVLVAINSSKALKPVLAAIESGKQVALANKEALVMAGEIIMKEAAIYKAQILPIDSEQSAIWQCLNGNNKSDLKCIHLTASGGPLYKVSKARFKSLSKEVILNHPRWKMGKKITVDSATMMNKGLEIIEAMWLFGVRPEMIKVLIHPQAIVHSMIEFIDGSILAQLGITDMALPIQYALSFPERLDNLDGLDFNKIKSLDFDIPDLNKFPCLEFAIDAAKTGGTLPCVLNAADEEVVKAFLEDRIKFHEIPILIERIITAHKVNKNPNLDEIFVCDDWARNRIKELVCL